MGYILGANMYIQDIVEMFYLGLVILYIIFIISFAWITSRGHCGDVQRDGGEAVRGYRGMERSEKTWLVTLIIIAIIGNAIFLSPLIPSVKTAVWTDAEPTKSIHITIENYTYILPENPITIPVGEPVEFVVISNDVTYGFGVFASDGKLVFQMQVLPHYENRITWVFDEPGSYTIRSTEYSGPNHSDMVLYDAIIVGGGA